MPEAFQLEVCVDRIDHAVAAARAGATRIEMNSALACDGLTPSLGSCRWLVEYCPVPVVAMLRPHDTGFVYSPAEKTTMLQDCELILGTGVAGIVSGALDEAGRIDVDFTAQLVRLCSGREMIFHRAFDTVEDQPAALAQLIDCGVQRVLTSGGASHALAGSQRLRQLIELSGKYIEVLPGAGVHSGNVRELVESTGCRQVHGSFRDKDRPEAGPNPEDVRATCSQLASVFA